MRPESTSLDLIETAVTRDRRVTFRDGSWGSVRVRPDGLGWVVAHDGEKWTRWQRRRVVVKFPRPFTWPRASLFRGAR